MNKLKVNESEIAVIERNGLDYLSLTDMVKASDEGDTLIKNWLRNKNTLEYLGIWERLNNPDFNYIEFDLIKNEAGTNRFMISSKQWIERMHAIGLLAKTGRYGGGTYAHKDIALHFAMWISPELQLLIVKEFQRLKDNESRSTNSNWDYCRFLSKVNYRLQTDAIRENIIPLYKNLDKRTEKYIYSDEAELLNVAVFGTTSKEWKKENAEAVAKNLKIRDKANVLQLTILANLESLNAPLIRQGKSPADRLEILKEAAVNQFKSLIKAPYASAIAAPVTSDPIVALVVAAIPERKCETIKPDSGF